MLLTLFATLLLCRAKVIEGISCHVSDVQGNTWETDCGEEIRRCAEFRIAGWPEGTVVDI